MSISRQNLSIVIVTFKSEKVIHQCLKSINQNIPIIVVENSNNRSFKADLESKYQNLKCVLCESNLGMGAGNNIGIKLASTDYVFVLNPDVILEKNTLDEIFLASKQLDDFTILSPLEKTFVNYKMHDEKNFTHPNSNDLPFKVDSVDGFAMLINKKKIKGDIYFDEKFFMYLENNDLCRRVINGGGLIYIIPKSKIDHLGGKAVEQRFADEVEISRNWHWVWSKYYFNQKHFGFLKALKEGIPSYFSSIVKFLFYFLVNNKTKKKIYFNRASGFYNAFLGKSSWYRPKLDD